MWFVVSNNAQWSIVFVKKEVILEIVVNFICITTVVIL